MRKNVSFLFLIFYFIKTTVADQNRFVDKKFLEIERDGSTRSMTGGKPTTIIQINRFQKSLNPINFQNLPLAPSKDKIFFLQTLGKWIQNPKENTVLRINWGKKITREINEASLPKGKGKEINRSEEQSSEGEMYRPES